MTQNFIQGLFILKCKLTLKLVLILSVSHGKVILKLFKKAFKISVSKNYTIMILLSNSDHVKYQDRYSIRFSNYMEDETDVFISGVYDISRKL